MTRILLVGAYPPPYGGLSVQLAALRARLAAMPDVDVRVLDIGDRRHERRAERIGVGGPVDFLAKVHAHVRRGYTVHLHTNGHNAKSWLTVLVCAAVAGRRAVVSLGSGRMPAFVAGARRAVRTVARLSARRAGAFVVRNEPGRAALVSLGAAPARVRILPGFYGVSDAEIGQAPPAVARFRRAHRPLIGMVATRGPEYGLALLVDAAARLRATQPELGVLLLGPDELEGGCPDWVLSLGELERPALLAAMRQLDVFVRPSYFDGDASSVREALAMGVRVVASATDFRPAGTHLFAVGDADALAGTIGTALVAPPVRSEWSSLPALLALYDTLAPAAPGVRAPAERPAPAPAVRPAVTGERHVA